MSDFPIIAPFRGLRYDARKLSQVTAPPYDVINDEAQRKLYERDPHNVVRLILGYQFPDDTEANNRYTRSAATLQEWLKEGVLKRELERSFYLYEQQFTLKDGTTHIRRGFLALRRLEEFGKGKIQPHEKTLSGPKADRLLLTKACRANLSPIFSLYSDPERVLAKVLASHFEKEPFADFKDDDGVRQRLWRVSDSALFHKTNEIIGQKHLFIADGHHRYETALAYREWMRGQYPNAPEDSSFNYVLMFFSDMEDPGLVILPTHRVLHDWPGFEAPHLQQQLKEFFAVRSFAEADEEGFLKELKSAGQRGDQAFGLSLPGIGFEILTLDAAKRDAMSALKDVPPSSRAVDTMVLHRGIFRTMLGLKEEDDKDPRYMTFVKDAREALAARKQPGTNAVFLLNSPPMPVLRDVVETGTVLPPKTTFFYPKLLSGLVFNPIDPAERVAV